MKKINIFLILLILALPCFSLAQEEREALIQSKSIKLGIGLEYLSRTIRWGDDNDNSKFKSLFFTFSTQFEVKEGLYASASFGYSFSNYEGLQFMKLPFTLDPGDRSIEGYLLGIEIKKNIVNREELEIDVLGQFFWYLGSSETWKIPEESLNVPGTAQGSPTWTRISIGPVFTYKGFESLTPYLYLSFNKLQGTFTMDETIQELEGHEELKIYGKSSFCTSLGGIYEISEIFSINPEASFMPYRGGVDLSLSVKALLSF
ncbi:MAG: hypothetical protein KAU46_02375 [Candidatus Aminicenantes bacterium]|nr:hypothetical protein [Candidatus Aminicenantes bacterium]